MQPPEPNSPRITRLLTPPARLSPRWVVAAEMLLAQALGVGLLVVYAAVAWWELGLRAAPPWGLGLGAAALLLGVSAAWAWRLAAPFGALHQALDQGTPVTALDPAPVRAALLVHRGATRWALGQWAAAGLVSVGWAWRQGLRSWDLLAPVVCPVLAVVLLVPLCLRYRLLVHRGIGVALLLLPDGRLDRVGPLQLERAWFHVGAMYTVFGAFYPVLLVSMARSERVTNLLLGLVACGSCVAAGYVGSLVLRALSLPSGHLEGRMLAVAQGELNTQALVMAPDTLGLMATQFNLMLEGLRQREHIREVFGRYVTRQVADEILSGRVALGGERRTATVLFADIHGFTRLAEALPPEEVLALLNEVLGGLVGCVLDGGGVLDKYIGDAIMALFGVPVSAGSPALDAQAAVRCALQMSQRLDAINAARQDRGLPSVEVGIGVHTGELVAGNIGIPERMEYTVIGDTVNVSARLEGMTRQLGHRILVSGATAALLEGVALRELEPVAVRGRSQPVRVYGVGG